jgi:hypothetical protein
VVGVPSPKSHLNCVSSGEPTGANESVSGADPRQVAVAGSYEAQPVTAMSIVSGLGPSTRISSLEASIGFAPLSRHAPAASATIPRESQRGTTP